MGDKNDPSAYTFPSGKTIDAGGTLFIPKSTFGFGINDSGEILYLKDSEGDLIDTWSN